MKYLNLRGAKFPALGFGTWQLKGEDCIRAVREALSIGYRHIDTAQIYENEAEVGQAIADAALPRPDLFVTTKLWTTNYKRANALRSIEDSLKKLQLDYVDLFLLHWPNPDVPLEETLSAVQDIMQSGKTKAIGISNFPVKLMREAVEKYQAPIVCNQIEYHALLKQDAVRNYAQQHDIAITAYSPLARGKLTHHPVLEKIGKKYGKTAGQIALRWLIEQDGVAAIPKSSTPANIRANFDIFDFALDDLDRQAIAQLGGSERTVNPAFAPEWDAA